MEIRNNIIPFNTSEEDSKKVKKINRRFTHSLEYEVIANLVLQQYEKNDEVNFDLLWTIQPSDRIPALVTEYGNKRMYHLIVTLLKEFCFSFPLPKSKKLNNTRINVCACDLMISAIEEELSIEDLILFFERIKKGKYGAIKKHLTHQVIKEKLAMYLEDRRKVFEQLSEKRHQELKALGPQERMCDEPKQIGEILQQATVIEMNKRMSG
jgi:hypothetical protein